MLGGGSEGSKEDDNLMERKVYCRRSFKGLENSKSSNNLLPQQANVQAMVSEGMNSAKRLHNTSGFDLASDNFSGLSRDGGVILQGGFLGLESNKVWISLPVKSKHEALELKRKLEGEREIVRSVMRKIEANAVQKINPSSHLIENQDRDKPAVGHGHPRMMKQLNQLNVLVNENSNIDDADKEKRTPKANKLYRNSDFLLGKDKIRAADQINKKVKSNGKKGAGNAPPRVEKFPNHVLKSCNVLLERLMKHKHSWVFNKPVDTVGLGLHDYLDIIKTPMDLGTVKDRLAKNWYKSPVEFAEDVRLTFRNAMTYNPKGQDVYVMAEQLAKIFEDKWAPIEADYVRELKHHADFDAGSPKPANRKALPQSRAMPKAIDRSESMASTAPKSKKTITAAQSGRILVPKKPKAKDPNKREMTYEEKQKLSVNLQSLPSEKLENVVQIIKKRNPSLSQQDDEIEVDIDSVDTETLWELDRFITNYKKSVNKNKRMAGLVGELTTSQDQNNTKEKITNSAVTQTPKGSRKDEERVLSHHVDVDEPGHNNANQEASQSSSSSDSGSSSSDSEHESSSADGSNGGPSPKK